jgi:hypothetical protein
MQQQCLSRIKWLSCTAGKQALAAAADAIVAVPSVPAAAVRMLTAAGICVSDAQAAAAALKQQPGAELWVQARVAVHGPTAALCSSDAELIAAFGTAQNERAGVSSAASTTAGVAAVSAAAPPLSTAARRSSLLEAVACYALMPKVFLQNLQRAVQCATLTN